MKKSKKDIKIEPLKEVSYYIISDKDERVISEEPYKDFKVAMDKMMADPKAKYLVKITETTLLEKVLDEEIKAGMEEKKL